VPQPLFTPEQLLEESRPPCDRALQALAAGDLARLRFLLGRMCVGHFELFYGYTHWAARLAGKVLLDHGEPAMEDLLSGVALGMVTPLSAGLGGPEGEKAAMAAILSLWSVQLAPVASASESPDEVAAELAPCGTGGRLQLESWDRMAPQRYPRTSAGTPVFCRICEHFRRAVNHAAGFPFWRVVPDPRRPGFCRMVFQKRASRGERLFSPGELEACTVSRCARALRLLAAGRRDIAGLVSGQHREWRPLHDLFCLFVTAVFSWTDREHGTAALSDLVWDTYVSLFEMTYVTYGMMDDRSLLRTLVRNWHYHQATFTVTEEQERFVLHLDPCGSGGRLCRGEMCGGGRFRYGEGPLSTLREPSPLTFQRSPYPSYCIHCAATNRDQFQGKPWGFVVDGDALDAPAFACRQFLYKKTAPRRAPARLLEQVGLHRAEPLERRYQP